MPGLTAGGTSIVCEGLVSLRHTWPALSKGYVSRAGTTPGISYVRYISLQELKDYALYRKRTVAKPRILTVLVLHVLNRRLLSKAYNGYLTWGTKHKLPNSNYFIQTHHGLHTQRTGLNIWKQTIFKMEVICINLHF